MKPLYALTLILFLLSAGWERAYASMLNVEDTIVWSRGPDIPLPRGGYYAAWYRGGLLIAGGTYWRNGKKYWTDRVSFYDPKLNNWTEWEPLPRPLAYGVMAQVGGKLYLMGGIDEQTLYHDMYRLQDKKWIRIGDVPAGFVYAAATVVGPRIYVMGGGTSNNDLTKATSQNWSFDTRTLKWEKLEPVPGRPRVVHSITASGKFIYLFGGASQNSGEPLVNLNDAYRFDTVTKSWVALRPMPAASRALWAAEADGLIYLLGGSADRSLDTVYQYHPKQDEYRLVSRLPLPLLDTKYFYHKGAFYGATGEDKGGSRFSGLLIGRLKGR
jgi:N-acetylneuraminic acid mutarotase